MRNFLLSSLCLFVLWSGCSDKSTDPVGTPNDPGTGNQVTNEAIVSELNYARSKPSEYAQFLESMKQYFKGNLYEYPGETPLLTNEGVSAVQEAIDFLKNVPSKPLFTLSQGLSKAAADHRNDCGPKGITSHTGSDGSSMEDRINRYGTWDITIGENIAFGTKTARDIVIQLIIDDGVSSRGHRKNIFNEQFLKVGVAYGYHKQYQTMCVMDFAGIFNEKTTILSYNVE